MLDKLVVLDPKRWTEVEYPAVPEEADDVTLHLVEHAGGPLLTLNPTPVKDGLGFTKSGLSPKPEAPTSRPLFRHSSVSELFLDVGKGEKVHGSQALKAYVGIQSPNCRDTQAFLRLQGIGLKPRSLLE